MDDPYHEYLSQPTREHYTQLVIAYIPAVRRLVRRFIRSEDLVSDILQETFLELGRTRKAAGEVREPRSYALGVAFHLVQSHLRGAATRVRHEKWAGRLRRETRPAGDALEIEESLHRLHQAIDALPETLRAVIHLHAIEGLSVKQISSVVGCSEDAVNMRLSRARKRLRQKLGARGLSMGLLQLERLGPESRSAEPLAEAGQARTILARCSPAPSAAGEAPPARIRRDPDALTVPASVPKRPDPAVATSSRATEVSSVQSTQTAPKAIPFQPEGDSGMRIHAASVAPALIALGAAAASPAAETGDIDGDGRLSIRDMAMLWQGYYEQGGLMFEEAAPGSVDEYSDYFCLLPGSRLSDASLNLVQSIHSEALRRGVDAPRPHWQTPADYVTHRVPPLPRDSTVTVRVGSAVAPGGEDDTVRITLILDSFAPLTHFSFVLEAEGGILRILTPESWANWPPTHGSGDVAVSLSPRPYFITGGKVVATRGFSSLIADGVPVPPGSHTVIFDARLAQGTQAGNYALRLHPASEVLLEDGRLLAQEVEGDGSIEVRNDVTGGWDEWPLPLEIDTERHEVLGKIEFRLTDATGNPSELLGQGRSRRSP